MTPVTEFEEDPTPAISRRHELVLALDGFEGPLDMLLDLARNQKVDLTRISILELADQYLAFIYELRAHRLEVAADYLVMAAWLAFLKSRLILPVPEAETDEPTGPEMAAALGFQLQRLEAMRKTGAALYERPQLGIDVFARGGGERLGVLRRSRIDISLYDLLRAYADHKKRHTDVRSLAIEALDLHSVEDAIDRLRRMLGLAPGWVDLTRFLPQRDVSGPEAETSLLRRSGLAATLIASLELARRGEIELRQDGGAFRPLLVRRAATEVPPEAGRD